MPLFPEAPRAVGHVRARAGELQLKKCASAISQLSCTYTIDRLEGVVKQQWAELPSFLYLPSNAVLYRGRAGRVEVQFAPWLAKAVGLDGGRDG